MPRRPRRARRLPLRLRMPRTKLWADFGLGHFSFLVAVIDSETYRDTKSWEPVFQPTQRIALLLVVLWRVQLSFGQHLHSAAWLQIWKINLLLQVSSLFLPVQKQRHDCSTAISVPSTWEDATTTIVPILP